MADADAVRIPKDPEARARLAKMAGLTDEERLALDLFCFNEQRKRDRGVLLWDNEPRPEPAARIDGSGATDA